MQLQPLKERLTVCKIASARQAPLDAPLCFLGKTDEEVSLVCREEDVPAQTLAREDGWRGFRIAGTLDFSLVGVLARITGVLAEQGIGLFALSTYNTDYVLVRSERFTAALAALRAAGYTVAGWTR